MKINKNIYRQELDKAYTILKQQYIIIRCLLELVDNNNNHDDDLTSIKQTIQRVEQLIQSIEGDLNAVEYDIDLINSYINTINEYIAQNGNTTEIGGNLEVDGNGQVNGNLNINGNLTLNGEPLSVDSKNVVREDTLGGFLNTVFSYQSKEDIPNELQTQANVQNLKQISRDTTAIIARYGSFDYVIQIDTLVGDSSARGFIHGYIYNPNIKDIIFISINTVNGIATFRFNTDSGGTSETNETYLQLDSIIFDLLTIYTTHENSTRDLTSEEITFFTNFRNRLINGEKLAGIFSAIDYEGYNIIEMPCQGLLGGVMLNFGIYLAGNYDMNTFTMIVNLSTNVVDFVTMTLSPYSEQPGYWFNNNTTGDGWNTLSITLDANYLYTFLLRSHDDNFEYQLQLNLIIPLNDGYTVTSNTCTFFDSTRRVHIMVYLTYSLDIPDKVQIHFIELENHTDVTATYKSYFSGPIYKNINLKYLNS